jgi:squalene-hopene/tetraprenyl-beta-curcumene cyclase
LETTLIRESATTAAPAVSDPRPERFRDRVGAALSAAQRKLLAAQREDGHWCAELEGDTILEAEYVMLLYYLGRGAEERVREAANYLRSKALPEGGWAIYPGGPAEVSVSVKSYFVLKLLGDPPEAPHMARARARIRELGGLDATNSYTRIYLSIFGQYEWERAPAVPPELILFPTWFPFNLYEMSSWSRAIVVPLSIVWALKPFRAVPAAADLAELRVEGGHNPTAAGSEQARVWAAFFRWVDRAIKWLERNGVRPLRERALAAAERWILERLRKSDGLGAIFPPIINCVYAFDCLGYDRDDALFLGQLRELEKLEIREGGTLRVQPCLSPVWDTCQSLNTLVETGLPAGHESLARGVEWLLDHEVREVGDWRVKCPDAPPGGWYFEYANEFYPDCDDTAQVLHALPKIDLPEPLRGRAGEASRRALDWLLAMQNRDGGWASFDRGCDRAYLTAIPFADHNAMIDPSTADVTARAIEALTRNGYRPGDPPVRRAVAYLRREQEEDGSWYGRWGCNYLYGTWLALCALERVGEDPGAEWVRRATAWLHSVQNADGGWGETPASYDDPAAKGRGPSTAAQTAWALLGLFAAGDYASESVVRGLHYLLDTQQEDGRWADAAWTGTGFPRVFYLNYHDYSLYFPLLALARYQRECDTWADLSADVA